MNLPVWLPTGVRCPMMATILVALQFGHFGDVSDPEWERVETAAGKREITPAEFVRNAALAATENESVTFPPGIVAQIERIYRGVYLLATLKRDEMLEDGRQEELDRITNAARESQDSITENASE